MRAGEITARTYQVELGSHDQINTGGAALVCKGNKACAGAPQWGSAQRRGSARACVQGRAMAR